MYSLLKVEKQFKYQVQDHQFGMSIKLEQVNINFEQSAQISSPYNLV